MSISHTRTETVRELGAFERTIDLYMHRNPVQFSLVAEIDRTVSERTLARALKKVQAQHPLLRVSVDRRAPQARYRWAGGPIRIETATEGTPWQAVVAGEQTRPIAPEPGPLMRTILIPAETGSVIVLTFAHQITDGTGGMRVVADLVAALDGDEEGGRPTPGRDVPPSQEALLQALDAATPPVGPPQDELMNPPGELTQFSGRAPHVSALALQRGLTARLVARCRAEGVSVHAALCAAAGTVFHRAGRTRVRVLSPVDLRRAAGLPDAVANRFAGARTVSEAPQAEDFWKLAQHHHQALEHERTPGLLKAGSQALAHQPPTTPEEAEAMMTVVTAADIQITNLGVVEAPAHGHARLTALWGPAQTTQLAGEHVLGVATCGGRLRMTELTHDPMAVLLPDMATVLARQCTEPGAPSS
ncbi:peptide synthetase [Streptomyces halstedii]|uniref:phthiocerol/phthiodiolone dimycocerosyl transferase family protein n=1 Tax=Streptomyces TaxID=1883 RepID=UPI000804E155|nr:MULTISPECIES: peptide synthetase [unclassified Streptomyces]MYR73286.1 peptide synthetase [Streptomyces sp. SID4925]WSX37427.1 peptide synthetase [Streptomyces halstedii]SBU97399.1 Condensation domain-containing protein [Streptomyces sp. OspMP-M45]